MRYAGGVDVGSTQTKAVVIDEARRIVGRALIMTGANVVTAAQEAFQAALDDGVVREADVGYVIGTGYGRYKVTFGNDQVTEISCHARGAAHLFPGTRTVLDVGGQTMKASRLDDRGRVAAFRLNDKCAAGTGAFLEKTARYLGYGTEQIGAVAAASADAANISGVCAVFAESEVINHVSSGRAPGEILHGAVVSLVARSVQLMKRVRLEPEITLVGGIMRFPTMVHVLREELGQDVNVPPEPLAQFTAAIGAAVLGQQRLAKRAAAEHAAA